MESTYFRLGLPETLAVALVLACLCLCLAPWLGGKDVGPLKVPAIDERTARWMKYVAPIGLLVFLAAFAKVWPVLPGSTASPVAGASSPVPAAITSPSPIARSPSIAAKGDNALALQIVSAVHRRALAENFSTRLTNHGGEFQAVSNSIFEARKALQSLHVPYANSGDPQGGGCQGSCRCSELIQALFRTYTGSSLCGVSGLR